MWFHCTNVILHATVSILFTRVCFILGGLRRNFAIIAGLLFAVHPIHTEAVSILTRNFLFILLCLNQNISELKFLLPFGGL